MDPTPRRRARWALRGALTLALLAALLGTLFTAVIGTFAGDIPAGAAPAVWLAMLLPAALIWSAVALPFGAALGYFAALIWRS